MNHLQIANQPKNYGVFQRERNSLHRRKNIQKFSSLHEKINQETFNPCEEENSCTSPFLGVSSCQERQPEGFKDIYMSSYKTDAQTMENIDEVYIKLENHEHPIYLSNVKTFEGSLSNAVNCHQIGRLQTLAIKMVLLHNYAAKNQNLKSLFVRTLNEYSQMKYEELSGKMEGR